MIVSFYKRRYFKNPISQKIFTIGLMLLLLNPALMAKDKNDIKGFVTDAVSGEVLPYANILLKDTDKGTSTNARGYFILVDAPVQICTLEVVYIGYQTKKVFISNIEGVSKNIEIKLEPTMLEGEQITVVAEKYKMWKPTEEISHITFSPKQITALPSLGEPDIFRSLQLLPGISGVSDGSSGLYVRGGTPDQNLVMLDGMTVYHVDHFFGFFSAFNADAVKDVQVYKGGFPAKYGGRLSSVVELTGKNGDSNKKRFGFGINMLSANFMYEGPVSDKINFLLSARRSYSDIIESGLYNKFYDFMADEDNSSMPGPGGKRGGMMQQEEIRPSFYFYDINAKLTYTPSSKDIVSFSLYNGMDNLDDHQELGGLKLRASGSEDNTLGTMETREITDWGNIGSSLKWSRQWSDRFNSDLLFAGSRYFSNFDHEMIFNSESENSLDDSTQVFRGLGGFANNEVNSINDFTFRFDNDWHLNSSHLLTFGNYTSHIATNYEATLNDSITLIDRNDGALQTAFYLQDRWKITPVLEMIMGIRNTYYDLTGSFYVEPRLSFQYKLWEGLKFKGAWGRYNQFINQITNEDVLEGSRDFWMVADKNFKPGFSEHKILGLSYETDNYLFEVESYYKDLDNLIEYSRRFQQKADYGELFFFGSGVSKGIEFLAQKKAGAFNGWLSYTLGEVEHQFPNLNNGNPFAANHDRTHEFKSVNTYSKWGFDFSLTWVFASGQAYTSPENQYYIDMLDGESQSYFHVGDKNANRLPDYHRMDISISKHLSVENSWKSEIGLSIFNLYNHNNIWYRKYDLDVSPIVVSDVKMLGITPTLYFKAKL